MIQKKPPAAEPVATVAKALAALRSFVDGQDEWGVRELAVALEMPPSTVHRLLARLRMEGFVGYDKSHQKYNVGFEFSRLAAAVTQRHSLRQAALPLMRELTDRTGESVWLALYDDDQHRLAYIAESESPHAARYVAPLGRVKSLLDNACGIAILGCLPVDVQQKILKRARVRNTEVVQRIAAAQEDGYCAMPAGEVSSATMVAAVVRDATGSVVGSFGIVVPLHRLGAGQEKVLGEMVRDASLGLSVRLGAKLLGGASIGGWQDAVELISRLLRDSNPSLAITPTLGGGGRNLDDVDKGLAAYALTGASSLYDARAGRGQFNYGHERLRTVMHLSLLHFLVVVRDDREVHAMSDLTRLRVSPGEQGFSGAQVFEDALRAAGKPASAKPRRGAGALIYLDYPEGKRQLENGSVDAVAWVSNIRNPSVRDLERSGSTRLFALDASTISRMLELNPGYRRGTVPKSACPRWLEADLLTVALPTALVCRADRMDSEVYEVARTVYEHRQSLWQLSSVYEGLNEQMVLDGLTAPLHPGAERYFEEIGIRPRYATAGVDH